MSKLTKIVAATMVGSMALTGCQSMSNPFAKKQPVAEAVYVPDLILGDVYTLSISGARVACPSELPMQCMPVIAVEDGKSAYMPYNAIEGKNSDGRSFEPKAGVNYQVKVRPYIDNNNNQQTGKWQLVEIVSDSSVKQYNYQYNK